MGQMHTLLAIVVGAGLLSLVGCNGMAWENEFQANLRDAQNGNHPEWVDRSTGHRVIRLSREAYSKTLYAHQNQFTADGRKLVFTSPAGLHTVDMQTHEIEQIRSGKTALICVGRVTGLAYYLSEGSIRAVDPATRKDTKIMDVPQGLRIDDINCDETLAGGRMDSNSPQSHLITLNLRTGEVRRFKEDLYMTPIMQFSPTDPHQMLFCHPSAFGRGSRPVVIRSDDSGLTDAHWRTSWDEDILDQFFSSDGRSILYHLDISPYQQRNVRTYGTMTTGEIPRAAGFWLVRYDIQAQTRKWYYLRSDSEWAQHFGSSPDQRLFCGAGANFFPDCGRWWLYLFEPRTRAFVVEAARDGDEVVGGKYLETERLVNLGKWGPVDNFQFTPDGKWIVFTSGMLEMRNHIFAVEVAKAK